MIRDGFLFGGGARGFRVLAVVQLSKALFMRFPEGIVFSLSAHVSNDLAPLWRAV